MFQKLLIISIISTLVVCHPDGGRIIGGNEIDIADRPFHVAVNVRGEQICSGAILNQNSIVSAAHCIRESISSYSIRAGSTSQFKGGVVIDVKQNIDHPLYNGTTFDNDITILKLVSPLTFTDKIQPAKFAEKGFEVPDGGICVVSGWGDQELGTGTYPENLHAVEVPKANQETCAKTYEQINAVVTDRMMCAGAKGKDSCSKDSGGPLTYNGIHVGIVSIGYGCAFEGWPSIYSKISELRDFIDENA